VARLEDHLFARMPGLDPALHEDLARAILAEAGAARLDPLLVLAVIEVESRFDPSAVSASGALGLMQLLPATLQREAGELGTAASDPRDPVANVRAGVRYLRRCLDSYPDKELALMAYNAGPNRLYGWIQAGGAVPAEVAGYARRVLAEFRRLRRAIPDEPGPRLADARPLGR
jgi:soluble lytic murein transglycosylase-like protein